MTREPLRIGDQIEVKIEGVKDAVAGEVVTFRVVGNRQIVNLKTPHGLRTMAVLLSDPSKPAVIVPPIDPREARAVALSVLAGQDRGPSVTASANILAAAVLALTGGAA